MSSESRDTAPPGKRGLKPVIWSIVRVLLLIYAGFGVVLYFTQTMLIFPGGRSVHTTPAAYNWEYDEIEVEPAPDETSHGWYVYADDSRGVVLFSTGNAGTIADRMVSIGQFRDLGFDVCIYDYGGYGKSSGRPSEKRLYADIRAFWYYLTEERGVEPDRIVLFGRSLGSGPTCELATEVRPGAIILESAFLSVASMAREMFPVYPARLMVRHRFDNAAKIGDADAPLLFIHSHDDEIVSFRQGRELYELAPQPKEFLEIRGGHNDAFMVSQHEYEKTLTRFLYPLFPLEEETD